VLAPGKKKNVNLGLGSSSVSDLLVADAPYVQLRWVRSPAAYRVMIAIAGRYFAAGVLLCARVLPQFTHTPTQDPIRNRGHGTQPYGFNCCSRPESRSFLYDWTAALRSGRRSPARYATHTR
jgi:hypothetical protein